MVSTSLADSFDLSVNIDHGKMVNIACPEGQIYRVQFVELCSLKRSFYRLLLPEVL